MTVPSPCASNHDWPHARLLSGKRGVVFPRSVGSLDRYRLFARRSRERSRPHTRQVISTYGGEWNNNRTSLDSRRSPTAAFGPKSVRQARAPFARQRTLACPRQSPSVLKVLSQRSITKSRAPRFRVSRSCGSKTSVYQTRIESGQASSRAAIAAGRKAHNLHGSSAGSAN